MSERVAATERATAESRIRVELCIDGTGQAQIDTGIGFFDHMLTTLAKHALLDLNVTATGDLHVDAHHSVEDTAIVIGQTLKQALGDKAGVQRFAQACVPLDEALAHCVIDLAGRPYAVCTGEPDGQQYALIAGSGVPFSGAMTVHVLESLALNAGICLHMLLLAGRDPHHIVEAQFKALALALRDAMALNPRIAGTIPSTKGSL
ncbi:MAG: imidazoleglycerol-phosphate dehydratase HisB [Propionibacteriaceae bacterium]|nr:imidazoleglycerol-phosphate dehydratase HisB [Propionibacteriaceae bacterium]